MRQTSDYGSRTVTCHTQSYTGTIHNSAEHKYKKQTLSALGDLNDTQNHSSGGVTGNPSIIGKGKRVRSLLGSIITLHNGERIYVISDSSIPLLILRFLDPLHQLHIQPCRSYRMPTVSSHSYTRSTRTTVSAYNIHTFIHVTRWAYMCDILRQQLLLQVNRMQLHDNYQGWIPDWMVCRYRPLLTLRDPPL